MLRSMYSGISGLKNMQTKLDVIGNNIANVNTYGFKKSRVTFKDMMSQTVAGASSATETRGGVNPKQVGLGSTLATIDVIHEGSSLQTTNRALDLGIDGDGYFIVRQGNQQYYTRAGNFYLDDNGLLVNSDGLAVQAYQYNNAGELTNILGDVSINANGIVPATPTNSILFSGNLAANAIAHETVEDVDYKKASVYTQEMKVIDEKGDAHLVEVHFKKLKDGDPTATPATSGEWGVYINQDPFEVTDDTTDPVTLIKPAFTVTFDENGNFNNVTFDGTDADFIEQDANNADLFVIYFGDTDGDGDERTAQLNFDFNQLTQLRGASTAIIDPNGNTEGKLDSFNIGASGEISGVYSNGEIVTLGRIALAKFSNSSGLMKAGNNLFQESINSGVANVSAAGEGVGTLVAGSLEMSNVDLSEEFTEMIVAQRAFQANTRIITTSDEILQELVNLKR